MMNPLLSVMMSLAPVAAPGFAAVKSWVSRLMQPMTTCRPVSPELDAGRCDVEVCAQSPVVQAIAPLTNKHAFLFIVVFQVIVVLQSADA